MSKQIVMPKLGVTMDEGRISAWRFDVGDVVEAGVVLVDIESDKLVNEYESPESGTILEILAQEGDVVPVGEAICVIGEASEQGKTAPPAVVEEKPAAPVPSADESGTVVAMPKLGVTMDEGRISSWRYNVGDFVEEGSVLVDIESDKLVNEYASPSSGVLTRIFGDEGDIIAVGEPLCVLGGSANISAPAPAVPAAAPVSTPITAAIAPQTASSGSVKAVPMVRKLAKESNIDISTIAATGHNGCVTAADVRAAAGEQKQAAAPVPQANAPFVPANILPLTGMRGAVAKKMCLSNETVPQGTQFWAVDATELLQLQSALQSGIKNATGCNLSITALLIKVLAKALIEHPILNSVIESNQILQYSTANIAVAVAVEGGLMTPVLRGAEKMTLSEIVVNLKAMAEKARKGDLKAADLADGTFVLTNLGMYGAKYFTPIVTPPQTVMLGAGKIEEEAVVRNGQVVARPILPLSITMDHRAIDGVPGAQFMARVKELVETPWVDRVVDILY